jgi:hypothetical protein
LETQAPGLAIIRGFSASGPTAMELNPYYSNIADLRGRLEGLRGYL